MRKCEPDPSTDPEEYEKTVNELLPEVYDELRRLAASKLGRERSGQTLQPTALVHEAYLRLARPGKELKWKDDRHYFAAAAESMRRILIENARARKSLKRGGDPHRTELHESKIIAETAPEEILAVDEALEKFRGVDPEAAELVKLRYFGGLTIDEAAQALKISRRTADRRWAFARAWLYRELEGNL